MWISCGENHSGVITDDGELLMIGSNDKCQCGTDRQNIREWEESINFTPPHLFISFMILKLEIIGFYPFCAVYNICTNHLFNSPRKN